MAGTNDRLFPAFVTTERLGGPRTPISAERIVIDLGRDEFGNSVELSFSLVKRADEPGAVAVYAVPEPLPERRPTYMPTLTARQGKAVNTLRLAVKFVRLDDDG